MVSNNPLRFRVSYNRHNTFVPLFSRVSASAFAGSLSLSPFHWAAYHQMEKYVMQGGDVNKPNKLGDTPLHEVGLSDP